MNGHQLLNAMEWIDPRYIEAADAPPPKRRSHWVRWGAMAACLCLALGGVWGMGRRGGANTPQTWYSGYAAGAYFQFCDGAAQAVSSGSSLDLSALPYAQTRYFSDRRGALEAAGVLPAIESHPLFTLAAHYNSDGSLYYVELSWHRRSPKGLQEYSDLKVIAGYEEVPLIHDCIAIELDDRGHVLEPAVTVTQRDGVAIVARGRQTTEKSLTYQTPHGWYQISGSWNDGYAPVVELLDWFWEHPLNFDSFPLEAGDEYTYTTLTERPDAFQDVLPGFAAFGFWEEETTVVLKNGVPVQFEGHYATHAGAEQANYEEDHSTKVHWCILAEPDVYDLSGCLGDLATLTREQITCTLEVDTKVKFLQAGLLVIVYPDDADEAWTLISSLQEKEA